jgi:hypothetical protein
LCSCSTSLFWTLHHPNITVPFSSVVFKLCYITEKRSKTLSSPQHKAVKTYRTVQRQINTFSPKYIKVSSTIRWVVSCIPGRNSHRYLLNTMLSRHCKRYAHCCVDESPYRCRELNPSHPAGT